MWYISLVLLFTIASCVSLSLSQFDGILCQFQFSSSSSSSHHPLITDCFCHAHNTPSPTLFPSWSLQLCFILSSATCPTSWATSNPTPSRTTTSTDTSCSISPGGKRGGAEPGVSDNHRQAQWLAVSYTHGWVCVTLNSKQWIQEFPLCFQTIFKKKFPPVLLELSLVLKFFLRIPTSTTSTLFFFLEFFQIIPCVLLEFQPYHKSYFCF